MYCLRLHAEIRIPQISQDKAQLAGNGYSLDKSCNAGLGDSLRASRETAICCVVLLEKGLPFPAEDALHMTISRLADFRMQSETVHKNAIPVMSKFIASILPLNCWFTWLDNRVNAA